MTIRALGLAALTLATVAIASTPITTDKLIDKAKDFDGKTVTVSGKVADYIEKTSKKGNPYITFKLKGVKQSASVYLRGRLQKAVKNGDAVLVTGMFRREKKVGEMTFRNEIDASVEKGKPDNVKLAKGKS